MLKLLRCHLVLFNNSGKISEPETPKNWFKLININYSINDLLLLNIDTIFKHRDTRPSFAKTWVFLKPTELGFLGFYRVFGSFVGFFLLGFY